MPKLNGVQFRFVARSADENAIGGGKPYRHRLCNPLWRWAQKNVVEKWGMEDMEYGMEELYVSTTMSEDYDQVNMSSDIFQSLEQIGGTAPHLFIVTWFGRGNQHPRRLIK